MALSVCLLTRNEEQNLPRAIGSVAGVADQVVVVDTGSTDRSRDVAAELGAEVSLVPWEEDFAAGRNAALDRATGDWVLWLNPDEELLPHSRDVLRDSLTRRDAFAYGVLVQEQMQPDQTEGLLGQTQVRLFRRHPEVRYLGRLHPDFATPLDELAARENAQVLPSPVMLLRHAYLSQLNEAKLRWAVRLLELELRDRPGRLHYLIEHGRTLLLLNDSKGHAVLAQAVDQVLAARDAPAAPTGSVQRLLEYVMTVSPAHSVCRLTREEARELALRWFPLSPPILWRCAEMSYQAGDFKEAAGTLESLVLCGMTGHFDRSEGFDPSIIGAPAIMNLGNCYTRLQNWDRAEQCYRQLLESPTHQTQAVQNLAMVQDRRLQAVRRSDEFWSSGGFE